MYNKKEGGFLGVLAFLVAYPLLTLLGNELCKSKIATAKDVLYRVGKQKSKKKMQS